MLLERDLAIQQFKQAAELSKHSGKLLLIKGEAGVGKTVLLEHMRLALQQQFIWSGCDPLSTPKPYAPILEIAGAISNDLIDVLEQNTLAAKVANIFFNTLFDLNKGTIIVIEDVHWADNATLDLLKFIARRISFLPCLICISFRDDEISPEHPLAAVLNLVPSAHTMRIELSPFSLDAVKLLALEQNKDAQRIFEITSGNPFFVTELISAQPLSENSIPSSVRDTVNSKVAKLSHRHRHFVQFLSVMPYGIPVWLIEDIFDQAVDDLLSQCIRYRILMVDNSQVIRFCHELARLAVLDNMPITAQKQFHEKILSVLEASEQAQNIAWMVQHAEGALNAEKVIQYATLAANKAAVMGAHKEAASYFKRALDFSDNAETQVKAQLYESWAYEVGLTAHMEQSVIDAVRHAVDLWKALGRTDKVGKNLRFLARLYWYQGKAHRAEQFSLQAIQVFETLGASSDLAMAYSMRSQLDMLNDRTKDAINWADKALQLEKQFPNPLIRAHALNNKGTALIMKGDSSGESMMHESLDIALKQDFHEDAARVYTNLSDYYIRFKKLKQADSFITQGIQFDISHDLDAWTYYLVGIQSALRLEQGRFYDAVTISQGVQKLENQTLLMKLPSLLVLGRALSRLGDPKALEVLSNGLQNANATDEYQYMIPARLGLIEHAFFNHRSEDCLAHLHWFSELPENVLNAWQYQELRLWMDLLEIYTANKIQLPIITAPEPLAAIQLPKAVDDWMLLGVPYNAAMQFLASNKEPQDSKQELLKAYSIFEQLEASGAIAWLRRYATQTGFINELPKQKRGPYSKTKQHPLGLTSKEQKVLVLLAEGCSNAEIAETLCRSTRTIENHVSSILAKLNVQNRIDVMLKIQNETWLIEEAAK
ncbi:AAA family ATPase [Glaciecola sp. 1036]|uniref:AAA family ATPase n=1 Tax=Alteromonadaceae TaxID=72275 RepID=UPI003D04D1A4